MPKRSPPRRPAEKAVGWGVAGPRAAEAHAEGTSTVPHRPAEAVHVPEGSMVSPAEPTAVVVVAAAAPPAAAVAAAVAAAPPAATVVAAVTTAVTAPKAPATPEVPAPPEVPATPEVPTAVTHVLRARLSS